MATEKFPCLWSSTIGGELLRVHYCYSDHVLKPCVGTMIAMQSKYLKMVVFPFSSVILFHNWFYPEIMSSRRSYNSIEILPKDTKFVLLI